MDAHVDDRIARLFEHGLGPRESAEIFEHIRECSACERVYERYAAAERALYRGDLASLDRVAARVVANTTAPPAPARRRWFVPAGVFAAAIAGALIVTRADVEDLTTRGTVQKVDAAYAVRALRIRTGPSERVDVDDAASTTVRTGDTLKILYSTGAAAERVTITVIDSDGTVLYRGEPVAVKANDVEARLPGSIPVTEAWTPGVVTVVAEFTAGDDRWERTMKTTVEAAR